MEPQHPAWRRLRQHWLALRDITWQADLEALKATHRAALDDLACAGALEPGAAGPLQAAFAEAAFHVQRSLATCYLMFPFEATVREDLVQRARLLEEMAGGLDPAAVDKAREAIARDMAFLEVSAAGKADLRLLARLQSGEAETSPGAREAARVLAGLLPEGDS